MFVSLAQLCIVYVVKEVASFPGARSIKWRGAARKRTRISATDQPGSFKKDVKLLITVVYSRETV